MHEGEVVDGHHVPLLPREDKVVQGALVVHLAANSGKVQVAKVELSVCHRQAKKIAKEKKGGKRGGGRNGVNRVRDNGNKHHAVPGQPSLIKPHPHPPPPPFHFPHKLTSVVAVGGHFEVLAGHFDVNLYPSAVEVHLPQSVERRWLILSRKGGGGRWGVGDDEKDDAKEEWKECPTPATGARINHSPPPQFD